MDLVKWVLVFIVLYIILIQIKPTIETFYPQVQGLPFTNEPKDGKLYMCKDKNDIIGSCHGIGVIPEVFDKYKDSNAPCPMNWLIPGNSIYK